MNVVDEYFTYGQGLRAAIAGLTRYVEVVEAGNPDEFIQAATNQLAATDTALVWEMFTDTGDDGGRDNHTALLQGSFVVMRKAASKSDRKVIYAQTRQLALAVLKRMIQDGRAGPLLDKQIRVKFHNVSGQGVGPWKDSWWGWAYEFTWQVPLFD